VPRRVTLRPILLPSRNLKAAIDFLQLFDGFWPVTLMSVLGGDFHQFFVVFGTAKTDVDGNFLSFWYLVCISQAEFFLQFSSV